METVRQMNPVPQNRSSPFFFFQVMLRALALFSIIAAASFMVASRETVQVRLAMFSVKFSDSYALRFLLGVDGVACPLVLFSLVGVCLFHRNNPNPNYLFIMFLHDLIVMLVMIFACGAATAIGYVGLKGQNATAWFAVCNRVQKFCRTTGISIGLSYVAFLCLFVLTIMSSYKLKTQTVSQ